MTAKTRNALQLVQLPVDRGGERLTRRNTMKPAIIAATLMALTLAPLSSLHAQTDGVNSGLPGGHPNSDHYKPGNGDHGNDGSNGG
jgi:hypothetical protein